VTQTGDELVEAFRWGAVGGDEARQLRAAFRARFCTLDDGRASERVVRAVWLGAATPGARGAAEVSSRERIGA
jgi:hypothetical protein